MEYEDQDPATIEVADSAPTAPTRSEQAVPRHPAPGRIAEDALPSAWRTKTPVLCIAGRGPLDEAAASMLAQLLYKNGLKARVLKHEVTSRMHVSTLDAEGVMIVCLCYLEIDGTPSHLRYLLRRLRVRLPAARLLVGLWPTEQAILTDDRLRAALSADLYTCSLREAVEACLDAARADMGPTAA